jgi:hypothetical protein
MAETRNKWAADILADMVPKAVVVPSNELKGLEFGPQQVAVLGGPNYVRRNGGFTDGLGLGIR